MAKKTVPFAMLLTFGFVVLATVPASAVIKPDTNMKMVYGMCTQVIHGEVTAVDLTKQAVHVKVVAMADACP